MFVTMSAKVILVFIVFVFVFLEPLILMSKMYNINYYHKNIVILIKFQFFHFIYIGHQLITCTDTTN